MISIKINDVKNFMNHLLVKETFDALLICEGEIHTATKYRIQGQINEAFFSADELSTMEDNFLRWRDVRHIVFEMIKGKRVPTQLKLVFALPHSGYPKIIQEQALNLTPEQIAGLHLHIHYSGESVQIITGTSLSVFTMDKSLDHAWDRKITDFLSSYFDCQKM